MNTLLIVVVAVVVAAALFVVWRRKKQSTNRMVTVVALLKERQYLGADVLIRAAREAWGADLGRNEPEGEGPDGFVVGDDELPSQVIQYKGRMIVVNRFDRPYVDDPDAAADQTPDLRIATALRNHTA